MAGNRSILENENLDEALDAINQNGENERHEFLWGDFWILPLHQRKVTGDVDELPPLLGLLGIARRLDQPMDKEQRDAVWLLADRAALARRIASCSRQSSAPSRICSRKLTCSSTCGLSEDMTPIPVFN